MKKPESQLALSVVATLIAAIALIYTLIVYHDIIFAVAGMSLIFLIAAYVLTKNLIDFSMRRNISLNMHLRECMNDISTQLETIHGSQSQISKATFLYTRQAAQALATLEDNYLESQEALYKNLTSITSIQNKATKLMIKYDLSNTTKVISTIKELRNQLSDTMIHGFDQIQPNNNDIIGALEDIVNYLKSQPGVTDHAIGLQLTNVARELQNISNSIQQLQTAGPVMNQTIPMQAGTAYTAAAPPENTSTITDNVFESEVTANIDNNLVNSDVITEETILDTDNISLTESISDTESDTAFAPDITMDDLMDAEETILTPELDDPNKQMSADEIAALFATSEPTPQKKETVSDTEDSISNIEEDSFTPTFTVVDNSTVEATSDIQADTPETIGDLAGDSNKQLSADEIAALFAASDPAPKKPEKTVDIATVTPTVSDDPNKQMSADEIAALFASAEPAPRRNTSDEEKQMDEAIAKAEPVHVTPASDDPNKQMSADEIAALFASLG